MYINMKVKKSDAKKDDITCIMKFYLKGNKTLTINTTLEDSCDFVDYINRNQATKLKEGKVTNGLLIGDKFFVFDDIKMKKTVAVNINEIKTFEIPFIESETEEELEIKALVGR